ncbi:MAG: MarR family transcriptional regulator, partial [Deltaproteobacteria bacterium]|nr:MarR family transcriptional regulator [Deltaproteobacteria bacterium]
MRARTALKKAFEKREATIQPKDVLLFDSVESYQRFMSDQKYAILATIYKYEPQSIYQLAKLLNRPPQNVTRECDLLEQHGFIT